MTTSQRLQTGSELGAYRLDSLLGAGGMGEVYRAKDVRLGRWVAIKVLLPQSSADVEARRRFEREARAIANLNHPNICTLHDIGSAGGVDYIVMEYLEGDTLAGFLATRRLPMDRVLGSRHRARQRAGRRPLSAHHSSRPEAREHHSHEVGSQGPRFRFGRVPRGQRGRTGRGDAGKSADGSRYACRTWRQSSELARNATRARTSTLLGLLLAEMATGRRHISAHEPLSPDLPAQFAFVVERCLAPDPDDRWQSSSDVRLALECVATVESPASAYCDAAT